MPDANQVPDARAQLANLEERVANLERRINFGGNERAINEIVFSYAGSLSAAESPPIKSRYSHVLVSVAFLLGTAGTTATVIEVRRNGVAERMVSIPSGKKELDAIVDVPMGADQDVLTLAIVTVGTGAKDLTGQARFA